MKLDADSSNILYGDTQARGEDRTSFLRLDQVCIDIAEKEQNKDPLQLQAGDLPVDLFALLKEGMPDDRRVPDLIFTAIDWICNTSIRSGSDELSMIYEILAWAPALLDRYDPDERNSDHYFDAPVDDHIYKMLVNTALRISRHQGLSELIKEHLHRTCRDQQIVLKEYPELIIPCRDHAYLPGGSEQIFGRSHCLDKTTAQPLCGRSKKKNWRLISRIEDEPADVKIIMHPSCQDCQIALQRDDAIITDVLSTDELSKLAEARVRDQLAADWVAGLDHQLRQTPEAVCDQLERQMWSIVLKSIPVSEQLESSRREQLEGEVPPLLHSHNIL